MTEYRVSFFFRDGTKSESTMTLGEELLSPKLGAPWLTITPSDEDKGVASMTIHLEHVYKIEYVPTKCLMPRMS